WCEAWKDFAGTSSSRLFVTEWVSPISLQSKLRCLEKSSTMFRRAVLRFVLSSALLPSARAQVAPAGTAKSIAHPVIATGTRCEAAGNVARNGTFTILFGGR